MVAPRPGQHRTIGLIAPSAPARLQCPVSDAHTRYESLCHLEAHDGLGDDAHAFLAYQETALASGVWRVRVKSLLTPGGVFEPATMAIQARLAAAQGRPYFVWGYHLAPSAADPRQIEFRVHVLDGRPARLELFAQFRRADGGAAPPRSAVCDWP